MNEQRLWTVVFILGAIGLLIGATRGIGSAYVRVTEVNLKYGEVTPKPDAEDQTPKMQWVTMGSGAAEGLDPATVTNEASWMTYAAVTPGKRNEPGVVFSMPRTIGLWVAGLLTLCIFSFLYGDNVCYKLAESIVIGSSAAYVMVVGFWSTIVGNLMAKLSPDLVRAWALPGLDASEQREWTYLFVLILSVLLLWRLAPKGAWISRWPIAFFIGATAGFRLIGFMGPDFVGQIRSTIFPLWVETGGEFSFWGSMAALTILVGVLACLVYFFFSIEHKGVVGKTARVGIWFLMITFGAGFGYTVMGRIALLSERLQFLFDDWWWLIDPTDKRLGM